MVVKRPWSLRIGRQTDRRHLAAIAAIGFIAAVLALLDILVPFDWWRILAIGSAAVSLLLLVIFWHPYLIDVVILATLIFFNLTPE